MPERVRHRYTLEISSGLHCSLERLARDRGRSKGEVLVEALELLLWADKVELEGYKVGARREREFEPWDRDDG